MNELEGLPKQVFYQTLAQRIDGELHRGYRLYPCNYIAADMLSSEPMYSGLNYNDADKARFEKYLEGQLAKITIPDKDEAFLRERILTMYANPLYNQIETQ